MCVRKNSLLIVLMVMLSILYYSCEKNTVDGTERAALTVKAVKAVNQRFDDDLNSFGTISYKTKNDITTKVDGQISRLYVKEGDSVRNGQLLAQLTNVQIEIQKEQYENSLSSAQAALLIAETKMREARLGVESRMLSLDKNRLSLIQLELELEEAEISLAGRKELHEIGGLTDEAYKSLQLTVSSKEAAIAILKKDIEIGELGFRDSDLSEAGYVISTNAQAKMEQFIELNTRSVAAEIESAAANVRNAEKSLDSVQKLVDALAIRSTVDGVVGVLYFENGEYVPQNEKIMTIMDIARVYAVFYIQEQDIINFSFGSPLSIEIPSLKMDFNAFIDEISPIADPQSGNFSVKSEIENSTLNIKPGMFVKCVIPRSKEEIFPVIPETSVFNADGNTASVYSIVNGIAVQKQIQVEGQKNGFVWIASGINENEMVIDKPSPFLKEGEYVAYK